jgi:hypothetical protein
MARRAEKKKAGKISFNVILQPQGSVEDIKVVSRRKSLGKPVWLD